MQKQESVQSSKGNNRHEVSLDVEKLNSQIPKAGVYTGISSMELLERSPRTECISTLHLHWYSLYRNLYTPRSV